MAPFLSILCPVLLALGAVSGESVEKKPVKAVKFSVGQMPRGNRNREERIGKRGWVKQAIDNQRFLYYSNVTLGTPPQRLRLHLDTGSSDLWVASAHSKFCGPPKDLCRETGLFNPNKSSTFEHVNNHFYIHYADYEYARGEFGKDNLGIGGVVVKGMQFGIGHDSNSTEGVMGLGFNTSEAGIAHNQPIYPNFPDMLVKEGLVNTKAYSLWLNDPRSPSGEILFGAVDTEKFNGKLQEVPLLTQADGSKPRLFRIGNTGISMTDAEGVTKHLVSEAFPLPVVVDSGTSYIYLPPSLAQNIHERANASYYFPNNTNPVIPCAMGETDASIDFRFGDVSVKVAMHELVFAAFDRVGQPARYDDGTRLCYFGIMESTDGIYTLGDTFLRSVYAVYDLDNYRMAFAQTRFNSTESNVVEIMPGRDGIPFLEAKKSHSPTMLVPSMTSLLGILLGFVFVMG